MDNKSETNGKGRNRYSAEFKAEAVRLVTSNCWDNAVAESFFRSLKVEAIYGYKLNTRLEAENRIFNYVERFYNTKRVHPFLLYKSPVQFQTEVKLNPGLLALRQDFLN